MSKWACTKKKGCAYPSGFLMGYSFGDCREKERNNSNLLIQNGCRLLNIRYFKLKVIKTLNIFKIQCSQWMESRVGIFSKSDPSFLLISKHIGLLPHTLGCSLPALVNLWLALLVIGNASHLNQVFLIWAAGNYPIHLRGTLPFNINHGVRLHQPHCVRVTTAAQWWMCTFGVHSLSVWAAGSSVNKQPGEDLFIWDAHSPYWSSSKFLAKFLALLLMVLRFIRRMIIGQIIWGVVLMASLLISCIQLRGYSPCLTAKGRHHKACGWTEELESLDVLCKLARETKRKGSCIFWDWSYTLLIHALLKMLNI